MKILGIIVEYNPMHNGHVYQIEQAKKLINPDYTVIIMSGNFTEQGNVSVLDKFTRSELAIQNGIDLVLELPTIYATSSAEYFAKGAVNILNSINCITHLVFGEIHLLFVESLSYPSKHTHGLSSVSLCAFGTHVQNAFC